MRLESDFHYRNPRFGSVLLSGSLPPIPSAIRVMFFALIALLIPQRAAFSEVQGTEGPPRICTTLLEHIAEDRSPLAHHDLKRLIDLVQRAKDLESLGSKDRNSSDENLPLTQEQLETLVKIEIDIEEGRLNLLLLNELQAQIHPDFRDPSLVGETPNDTLRRFKDLLDFIHVRKSYERLAPRLKTKILDERKTQKATLAEIRKALDQNIQALLRSTNLDANVIQDLSDRLSKDREAFLPKELELLRGWAKILRKTSDDDTEIASRIALALLYSRAPGADLNSLERALDPRIRNRRINRVEMAMSQDREFFENRLASLSPADQATFQAFRDRFKAHLKSAEQSSQSSLRIYYPPKELSVAFDILERALYESKNSKRTHREFARWALESLYVSDIAVAFVYSVNQKRATYSHRLLSWMRLSRYGWSMAFLASTLITTSSTSQILRELGDPRFLSYRDQWHEVLRWADSFRGEAVKWVTDVERQKVSKAEDLATP